MGERKRRGWKRKLKRKEMIRGEKTKAKEARRRGSEEKKMKGS